MTAMLYAFTGLFLLRLIKSHGWEYVPLVLLAFGGWTYMGGQGQGGLADALLLSAVAGIHLVTRKATLAERAMSAS
jgi:hypothetical protein